MVRLDYKRLLELVDDQENALLIEIKSMALELLEIRFEEDMSEYDKKFHREMSERAKNGENLD